MSTITTYQEDMLMINNILLYAGSFIIIVWGIAHLVPTKVVVEGFGSISDENKRIITMEWVGEGLTLCFIGVLVLVVTILGEAQNPVSLLVYRTSSLMVLVMAGWTFVIGSKTTIMPIKVCPLVLTVVAILFFLGSIL